MSTQHDPVPCAEGSGTPSTPHEWVLNDDVRPGGGVTAFVEIREIGPSAGLTPAEPTR
jgi:hypothetical protein